MILMRGTEVNWAAMPLSGVFETADEPLVLVGAFKANPLRDICAALELPDLSLDPRFANLEAQFANKPELQRQLRERFRTNTRDHWLQRLEAQDLLCAPVRDMREVLVDPQTVHNRMILQGETPQHAAYKFIASPIRMSAADATLRRAPPKLGEHTDEVLTEVATKARAR
jgi:formyl-CoA transferase